MPICTPECTVPIRRRLVAFDQTVGVLRSILGLGFVVELDDLHFAAAELAALLGEQQLDGKGDVLAELGEVPE